ncbi:MAG: GGDEF domain-containing protein [Agathobacter sp.]|nr:GGDEF domain-containing protein [Agathobacter sp.]
MERVALVTDGWKRSTTYAWTKGILDRIQWAKEEVCLYQYQSYGNWSKDYKFNQGEYNIINFPDFSHFDGIILDCNNVVDQNELDKIVDCIGAAGVPVVSIGRRIEEFYYVGIDNDARMKEIVHHLYREHGCRSFVWAGGPLSNYENIARRKAFSECMQEFGIEESADMYLYGDFDFGTGEKEFFQYVQSGKPMPHAFVCANDNIAAGLCAKAIEMGYRVPEDFKVTGFDNLDKALYFKPQIATVSQNREDIGFKAMDMLFNIWRGQEVPREQKLASHFIAAESCGCGNNHLVEYRDHARDVIVRQVAFDTYDARVGLLEDELAECDNFQDAFKVMTSFLMEMKCDGFYFLANKKLVEPESDMEFSTEGYDFNHMIVAAAHENGQDLKFGSVQELFAHLDRKGAGECYFFTPIHFRNLAVGVSVIKNGRFLEENTKYYDINKTFSNYLESLYRHTQLEHAMLKIREVYDRDQLTGLYNRVAYQEMIVPLYKKCTTQGEPCALAFFDVDNFKIINDTKGHRYGDEILKSIAEILLRNEPAGGYSYRFGGDEFVVFFPDANEERVQQYKAVIEEELKKIDVMASAGIIITDPNEEKTLDDYLLMADKKMYQRKRIVHASDK